MRDHDTPDVKRFGYRTPRYAFPRLVNLDVNHAGNCRVIPAQGVDISANGIGLTTGEQLGVDMPVTLEIPLRNDEVVRVPGRVLYRYEAHYGFVFEYSSAEQCRQIQDLITQLGK